MSVSTMEDWRLIIRSLYPGLMRQIYCVPPVYFNRVPYTVDTVAGQPVLVALPPSAHSIPTRKAASSRAAGSGGSTHTSVPTAKPKQGSCEDTSASVTTAQTSSAEGGDPSRTTASTYSLWTQMPFAASSSGGIVPQPEPVDDSATRDDFAQQHVLHCMQKFGAEQKEGMFIVSQLSFSDYLSKPRYASAAAILPTVVDMPKDYHRGDFDILLVHIRRGFLLGEVKSVGLKADVLHKTSTERDADVAKRTLTALKQLEKGEKVLRHMMKDIAPGLIVKNTVILPYVTSAQLHRVLTADTRLEQKLCTVLGAIDAASAVKLCVCSDQLSNRETPWDVTSSVINELGVWFRRRMDIMDPHMTREVYLDIVARVAGPATTVTLHCVIPPRVEVRTLGQAVSESGERLSRIVLTTAQLDLLNRSPEMVFLTGPPGTGKTLMLVLKGLQWLRQGCEVHVVSTKAANLAVSHLAHHQLQMTLKADGLTPADVNRVRFHQYDFYEDQHAEKLTSALLAASHHDQLYVLLDEADVFLSNSVLKSLTEVGNETKRAVIRDLLTHGSDFGGRLRRVITELQSRIRHLHLWAASMYRIQETDEQPVELLTVPLRYAPVVLRELEPAVHSSFYAESIHRFTSVSAPSPCDGPEVMHMCHNEEAHSGRWPVECSQCGHDLARILSKLRVGDTGVESSSPARRAVTTSDVTKLASSPPPLKYRDVIVLTRSSELRDDVIDGEGKVTSPACGFIVGLREAGIPTFVLERDCDKTKWEKGVAAIAVAMFDQRCAGPGEKNRGLLAREEEGR